MTNVLTNNSHLCTTFRVSFIKYIFRSIGLDTKQQVKDKTRPLLATQNNIVRPALDYFFRDIKQEDIPKIMAIRKNLKIHDCYSCLQTWSQVHPQGIFIAEDKRGSIVGTGGFVHNSVEICTGGIVYVDPQLRSSGIGREILQLGLQVSQGRNMCGNAVESMTRVYCDIFQALPRKNFTILRNLTPRNVNLELLSEKLPPDVTLQPFRDMHLESVNEYDSKLMGYDRGRLLDLSCREENSQTFVALNGKKCVGFGSVKLSCLGATRVGPLYADDATIAEALLKELLKSFPGGKGFMMMTLSNNVQANNLMAKLGVPTTQQLVQVFTKRSIEVDTDKVYAHFDVNFCVF